jgi:hypothetical protein
MGVPRSPQTAVTCPGTTSDKYVRATPPTKHNAIDFTRKTALLIEVLPIVSLPSPSPWSAYGRLQPTTAGSNRPKADVVIVRLITAMGGLDLVFRLLFALNHGFHFF